MIRQILLLSIPMLLLASCKGQTVNALLTDKETSGQHLAMVADTVTGLDKNIMVVYQDDKNNYWFGSWENGLYVYDGSTILHYHSNRGLPNNRIDEIKGDKMGNVYINTSSGIIRYDGKHFKQLTITNTPGQWELDESDVWFKDGWNSGNVLRYDGDALYKLKLPTIEIGEESIRKHPSHPNPYTVYSLYKDNAGNMWFGTGALGALRYNGKTFDWNIEKDVAEIFNDPSEPSNGVRSIMEDSEGYFWFTTMYRYQMLDADDSSDQFSKQSRYLKVKSIGSLDGRPNGNLFEYLDIEKDNKHTLWFVTYQDGVYSYDGSKIRHYTIIENGSQIKLFSIYKDNNGQLLLGTHESGVYQLNGDNFQKFLP